MADQNKASPDDVNPEDFLRALMKISPEDAEKARERSPATRPRGKAAKPPPTEERRGE